MEEVVEIDENERYWVGGGYGKKGLLPTDRGAFTTVDGSLSWRSADSASEDLLLLGRGWSYEPNSQFTPANHWLYSSDFRDESMQHAKPDSGMSSFVRFRRLYRTKIFNPDEFVEKSVSEKCSHVDSFAVDALSHVLLDVLAYCTLLHSPIQLTDAVSLPLKKRIIDVAIAMNVMDRTTDNAVDISDAILSLDKLKRQLENFVEEERGKTIMHRLVHSVDFSFHQRADRKEFQERQHQVSSRCFTQKERYMICSLIIKKLDPRYELHCNKPMPCGDGCKFKRISCPHDGCKAEVSQMHLSQHMATCPFKVITCDCGDHFPLKEIETHKRDSCQLRVVPCPFKEIGCIKEVVARHLPQHVQDDVSSHLLLAMNRMLEHQEVIKNLHTKLLELEVEKNAIKQSMTTNDAEAKKQISELEAKLTKTTKELTRLESTVKKQGQKSQTLR